MTGRSQVDSKGSCVSHALFLSQILAAIASGFDLFCEYELVVPFAQAEIALARICHRPGKSLALLGDVLHRLGKLKEAEQQSFALLSRDDIDDYMKARCLNALARVIRDQGRLSEALQKAEEATAMALAIPEACVPPKHRRYSFLSTCHQTEASILERLGRLEEAIAKDKLTLTTIWDAGKLMRQALWAVAEGKLDLAKASLRVLLGECKDDWEQKAAGKKNTAVEGPDIVIRAKELMCQVLHKLGSTDPQNQAEEAALRTELHQEEARRGEALREVRALIRRVARDEEPAQGGGEVVPAVKTNRKKKKRKSRQARRRRAAAEEGEEEGEDAAPAEAAAAVSSAAGGGEGADESKEVDDLAAMVGDMGLQMADELSECPVCLQALRDDQEDDGEVGTLACGHEYHVVCLDMWVCKCVEKRLDVTCPCCRAAVCR
jgi:tetratricopeptide (TPR) repeat protein